MNSTPRNYGSTYHLQSYRDRNPERLDTALTTAISQDTSALTWHYPGRPAPGIAPTNINFLPDENGLRSAWECFWPTTGTPLTWDGIAHRTAPEEWVLIEAKANHPEFCSPPTGSGKQSREKIDASLRRTQRHLGVHAAFCWAGTYYQYANRLAFLYFMNTIARIPARLVFLYFTGDTFPDKRPCPATRKEWEGLITACHLTLGLPEHHALSDRIYNVFLPCG
jgi:hypothetical protein